MKILVLGSNGMAGHMIVKYLSDEGYKVTTFARNNADILGDIESLEIEKFFDKIKNDYDYIINCIGMLVKESNDQPTRAILVNSWFPQMLATKLQNTKTRLIHLSTDCVFDGKIGNYKEDSAITETNFYGRSKALGEVINNKDITFRLSIIGPEIKTYGSGLFNWFTTCNEKQVSGWVNAQWNGMTTLQLAKCINLYIKNPCISGLYHLVNNDININKYDLLTKINNIFNVNIVVNKTQGPKSVNKVLIDTRNLLNFEIPNYDIQLEELKAYCQESY